MPAMAAVVGDDLNALLAYLFEKEREVSEAAQLGGTVMSPYIHQNYYQLRDEEEYPAIKPPWGTLNAIELQKGVIVWEGPLGGERERRGRGMPPSGSQSLVGARSAGGGLEA